MTKKAIGLLGGTFDPVHHGHLRLALEILEQAGLDHVRMIPLHTPAHRDRPVAEPEQRREMLRLALEGVDRLVLEDCELERGGVSYTIDTLEEQKTRFPDSTLCLIMGMDALQSLDTWHRWRDIPEAAHIVVVERPGETGRPAAKEIESFMDKAYTTEPAILRQSTSGGILGVRIPLLDISSTHLRQMLVQGRDTRFLLPLPVLEYIHQGNLYGSKQHDQ